MSLRATHTRSSIPPWWNSKTKSGPLNIQKEDVSKGKFMIPIFSMICTLLIATYEIQRIWFVIVIWSIIYFHQDETLRVKRYWTDKKFRGFIRFVHLLNRWYIEPSLKNDIYYGLWIMKSICILFFDTSFTA